MKKNQKSFRFASVGSLFILSSFCGCYPYEEYGWGIEVVGGYEEEYYESGYYEDGYYEECSYPVHLEVELEGHSFCGNCGYFGFDLLTPDHTKVCSPDNHFVILYGPQAGTYEVRVMSQSDFEEHATVIIRVIQNDQFSTLISETTQDLWIEPWGMAVIHYPLFYNSIYRCSH